MATITAIEVQKRHPDRVNIDLDGQFAFGLAVILAAGLKVGHALDQARIESLQAKDADEIAYQRALRLVSLRERSEAELRTFLRKHKTPDEVLERTLARLREHQHADDAHFAQAWVENRSAFRPRGRRALAWELRRKGVSTEVAETVIANIDETTLAYQAGLKKARQLSAADWPDFRTKVSAFLARRGFPGTVIAPTVSRLWSEAHAGQSIAYEEDSP
ncbi:MAG TPA: RecX family transcriptional regulator [Anaerolineales bacterium]